MPRAPRKQLVAREAALGRLAGERRAADREGRHDDLAYEDQQIFSAAKELEGAIRVTYVEGYDMTVAKGLLDGLGIDDDKLSEIRSQRIGFIGPRFHTLIGAIFLDGGYVAAAGFVERNWTERMRKPRRAA